MQKDAQAVVVAYDGKQQTRKFTQRVTLAVIAELGVVGGGLGGRHTRFHLPAHPSINDQ